MKITKEEFAKRLDGWVYGDNFLSVAHRFEQEAADNNLVFIVATCNDGCVFSGSISGSVEREDGELGSFLAYFEQGQVAHSDCGHDCSYFKAEMRVRMEVNEAEMVEIYYRGEGMEQEDYQNLGEPEWCILADFPHAVWKMYDSSGVLYSVGLVADFDELWQE